MSGYGPHLFNVYVVESKEAHAKAMQRLEEVKAMERERIKTMQSHRVDARTMVLASEGSTRLADIKLEKADPYEDCRPVKGLSGSGLQPRARDKRHKL